MTAVGSWVSPLEQLLNSHSFTVRAETPLNNPPTGFFIAAVICWPIALLSAPSFCSCLWLYFNHLHNLCLLFGNPLWQERSLNPTVTWINNLSVLLCVRLIPKFHLQYFSISRLVNPSCVRKMLCVKVLYKRGFSGLIRSWIKLRSA